MIDTNRLRRIGELIQTHAVKTGSPIVCEAADEIDRLRHENEYLLRDKKTDAEEIQRLRAQLASRGGVPEGWPTDAMVIRGAETLHDALRAEGEVVFIDGVGAWRSSIKSCRDGVQWIVVGDRVYWPLSDSDAKRLQSACCGNGSFDGPATPAVKGEQQ